MTFHSEGLSGRSWTFRLYLRCAGRKQLNHLAIPGASPLLSIGSQLHQSVVEFLSAVLAVVAKVAGTLCHKRHQSYHPFALPGPTPIGFRLTQCGIWPMKT